VIETAGLPPDAFAGETVIVTGAGRGIGQAAALLLARLGARVIVAELDPASGAAAAEHISAQGGAARFVPTDIADEAAVAALVRETEVAFGPPTLLVNNAAYEPVVPLVEMPAAEWDRALAVNLRGTFLACRACLPAMLAARHGTIVNLISAEAMPGMSAYITTKQGLVGLTQSLALEVAGQGVRVVAFAPGMVDTPGLRGLAGRLAPHLGLTPEQFLGVSLHAAYPGLMPPAHAAAALAYLVARLADEYHGESVTGYAVLERAGLIQPAANPSAAPAASGVAAQASVGGSATGQAGPTRADHIAQALALAQQLQAHLVQTDAEFDKLPVFARPLARGGFKSKTGQRLPDFQRAISTLVGHLQRMQATYATGDAEFMVDQPRLAVWLERLVGYYEAVPAETARFTRDAATLSLVRQQTADRVFTIRQLLSHLTALQPSLP
jgi:NAD(P)-dependent dehydrogenase (short-subunit alcohol dehydrogenase family)